MEADNTLDAKKLTEEL